MTNSQTSNRNAAPFQVVPVVDLAGGRVVHARGGARAAYRPVRSRLCAGADPVEVVGALLTLAAFPLLYAADLDAIAAGGRGADAATLGRIRRAFPALGLWVDAGLAGEPAVLGWLRRDLGMPVLGSESQSDPELPARLAAGAGPGAFVLSLDSRGAGALDPAGLAGRPETWPDRVVAMALDRVGSGGGPDEERLDEVLARAGGRRVYAAGGVRDAADLAALRARGAAGALVATALHEGRIGPAELGATGAGAGPAGAGPLRGPV